MTVGGNVMPLSNHKLYIPTKKYYDSSFPGLHSEYRGKGSCSPFATIPQNTLVNPLCDPTNKSQIQSINARVISRIRTHPVGNKSLCSCKPQQTSVQPSWNH